MLVELAVENLAILERAEVRLADGFTVLTGETGAGKSLLVDALQLALGERADSDLVRAGSSRATVAASFDLRAHPDLRAQCEELGIPLEDGRLRVQREVMAEGRSQCRVGGRLVPVATLRRLGLRLVDLHGQHDHQSLLAPERHLDFLDGWIGEPAHEGRAAVAEAVAELGEARRRLAALRSGLRDRAQRIDLLTYQLQEIEAIAPQPGEMEEQEALLSRLKYAERLAQAAFGALGEIADEEGAARDRLGSALKALEEVVRFDPGLEEALGPLRDAYYGLEEATLSLRGYAEALESDPARLEETAGRIDALRRLRKKYGEDEAAVLAHAERAREELDVLSDAEANLESLEAEVASASERVRAACEGLSALRAASAVTFADRVQAELRDLAMDRAVFSVRIEPKEPEADGADRVEFDFTANAGEPPKPLSRIASGGEISRVMLAIKCASAGRAGVPTLIFDEVDTGLGGRAAAVVAKKLEELARHVQVLSISHLPQIAARASAQFRIEKQERGGRVVATVTPLSADERVAEIARMLAGEAVTDSALANAREMLSGSHVL